MGLDINKRRKHIARFTREFTTYLGWRVSMYRQQMRFVQYFSDAEYGGAEASLHEAKKVLEHLKELMQLYPDDPKRAFEECERLYNKKKQLPPGMKRRKRK